MNYTINNFKKEFPDEKACLDYIFAKKYPNAKQYYFVKGRKCYANPQGQQLHPLVGTIFEKSSTPLTLWFYAIFLFASSKNGVSAKELQRQLGVTYKTAWRIAHQVRALMAQDGDKLSGIVEVDETYIGGYRKGGKGGKDKTPVFGMVSRGGAVKTKTLSARETHLILKEIKKNIATGSAIVSDKFGVYKKTTKLGFTHSSVNHWKKEYARGATHTNTIEGFWSQLKRSLSGTYHSVSRKYLQSYVNEFSFRYAKPSFEIFEGLMGRI
ncbi:MAG: IS1595 family transposase [Patescibacteria group bacterium]|nr:IS1595 family transposase [Patescibacteria group bacterium]MDE2438475.1 IS1595 family transposase [Patescibacteria group bacterium]